MFVSKGQRIERSANELERLRLECRKWVTERHAKDLKQQYKSQLDALGEIVERACTLISGALPQLNDPRTLAETFEHCRFLDQRVAWTRRLWEFFKEKFDQRDGPLSNVLQAADEVIWSCYHTPFRLLGGAWPQHGASPLPYIEPYLSPAAYPREIFPPGLTAEDRDFRRRFNELPIPLVRLSPLCIEEPWWLIYSAHEAGHQVQYDLKLVDEFQLLVEETIDASPDGTPETASLWGSWSREIFADLYSVGASGPQAALAMADAEFGTAAHLLDRQLEGYPAPLVRLTLLDEAATRYGFDHPLKDVLPDLKAKAGAIPPEIAADLKLLPLILETAFSKLQVEGAGLPDLIPPLLDYYGAGGKLEYWREQLQVGPQPIAENSLEAARLISAAAYQVWNEILAANNTRPTPPQVRESLAKRTLESLKLSRDESARPIKPAVDTSMLDDIAQLLLSPNTQLPPSLNLPS